MAAQGYCIVLSFPGQREKQYSLGGGARKPLSPGTSREELGREGLLGSISFCWGSPQEWC